MRLTTKNISSFLLEKGLLEAKSLVDGDYLVTQTQNRNAIFKVHIRNNKSLFVKQLVNFDAQNSYFLQKDATCCWLIKNEPAFAAIAKYVPDYYGYDPEKQVLIVEYLPGTKNVEEIYQAAKQLEPELLQQSGRILAAYHFPLDEKRLTNRSVQFFMRQLPWPLQLARSESMTNDHFAANYPGNPVIAYLRNNEEFRGAMQEHVPDYEFTTLIHGDVKWVNFIVNNDADPTSLKLIDWELSDIGDPLWDVAGVIQSCFTSKIIMAAAQLPYPANSPFSQANMEQSVTEIRQIWGAYAGARKLSGEAAMKALQKTIHFAGLRLVQTAFEHNVASPQLTPGAISLLQISHSLLQGGDRLVESIIHPPKPTPHAHAQA